MSNLNQYLSLIRDNTEYHRYLSLVASLSNLYADGDVPFIHYRATENLFCKCFGADNLARFDDSFDAKQWGIGIGIKTFVISSGASSVQKVAEFDKLSHRLDGKSSDEIARLVSSWRNDRIQSAEEAHGIGKGSFYHVIGRKKGGLVLFVKDYDAIDVKKIRITSNKQTSFSFTDGVNDYSFSRSKSTLSQCFRIPDRSNSIWIPISIIPDPFEALNRLFDIPIGNTVCSSILKNIRPRENDEESRLYYEEVLRTADNSTQQRTVVLPLFSTRGMTGEVPTKSGLNQWNANGRIRDFDEVYIPVPRKVHRDAPGFFPNRDHVFDLVLPNGRILQAKMCQDGEKGLMSNPNRELGKWLLRDVLKIPRGTLVTREMLNIRGYDSVLVIKESDKRYRLELSSEAHYSKESFEDDFSFDEGSSLPLAAEGPVRYGGPSA